MKNMVVFVLAATLGVVSCDRAPANFEGGAPEAESMMIAPLSRKAPVKMQLSRTDVVERKLIKNGTLNFSTKNIADTRKEIDKICKEFNAYISSDEQQKSERSITHEQVIRIPANRFDAFIKVVENLGDHIDYRNVTTQDVTEEFIDTGARLKTKKELESRYHQLLGKATKIEDMLAIEEQIAEVRTQIESMEGRLNFLTNQVGYSTLTVTYTQILISDFGFGSELVSSFITGWNGLLAFLVRLISAWPFILIITAGFWLLTRWLKKISFARQAKPGTV